MIYIQREPVEAGQILMSANDAAVYEHVFAYSSCFPYCHILNAIKHVMTRLNFTTYMIKCNEYIDTIISEERREASVRYKYIVNFPLDQTSTSRILIVKCHSLLFCNASF